MNHTYVFSRGYKCVLKSLAEDSKIRCGCEDCRAFVKISVIWGFAPQVGKDGILIWAEPLGLARTGETPYLDPAIERVFLQCWTSERPRSLDSLLSEVQTEITA